MWLDPLDLLIGLNEAKSSWSKIRGSTFHDGKETKKAIEKHSFRTYKRPNAGKIYRGLPSAGLPRPRDRSSRRCRQLCVCSLPNRRCGSNLPSLSPCCTVGHRRLRSSRIFINIRQTAGQANLCTRVVPMLFATDMLPTSSPLCRTYVRACERRIHISRDAPASDRRRDASVVPMLRRPYKAANRPETWSTPGARYNLKNPEATAPTSRKTPPPLHRVVTTDLSPFSFISVYRRS